MIFTLPFFTHHLYFLGPLDRHKVIVNSSGGHSSAFQQVDQVCEDAQRLATTLHQEERVDEGGQLRVSELEGAKQRGRILLLPL
jgi:hypothetical protein